jgi:hypothetical protein
VTRAGSKAEMQREIDALRHLVQPRHQGELAIQQLPLMVPPARSVQSVHSTDHLALSQPDGPLTSEHVTRSSRTRATEGRALDGFVMDARRINDCIDL